MRPPATAASSAARSAGIPSASRAATTSVGAQRTEVDPDAAAGDGHQLGREVLGQDDEHGGRRWLLDDLEQGRSGVADQVEVVEDDDLAVAFHRGERGPCARPPGPCRC